MNNTELNRKDFELLLPVGNKEMAMAAIHGGADAIFLGVPGFNARGRSHDFSQEELKEIIAICHLYGVKVNVAFNVVIFENELSKAAEALQDILALGVDAIIVQDLGLARRIRQLAPQQRVHASTQMSITNYEAIELLQDLNIQRFVLGRENSKDEIQIIRAHTKKELEVFVHGALCVSYSGQCFTSESLGGRSANRGQCAQSCRFAYDFLVDGELKNLGAKKYLVSPQDLCGIEEIPELMHLGVNSFKVEGRLKTPEYVATCAQEYRKVIDQNTNKDTLSNFDLAKAKESVAKPNFETSKKKLATTYSRGFYSGWLNGVNHQQLVEATFSSNRGYEFAKVVGLGEHCIQIEMAKPVELHAGDGLLWAYEHQGDTIEQGGFIYSVEEIEENIWQIGLASDLKLSSYCIGARVFFNHDKNQKREVALLSEDKNKKRRVPVTFEVQLTLGQPLKVQISDGTNTIEKISAKNIEAAKTRGTTDAQIIEELEALSGSPFRSEKVSIQRISDIGQVTSGADSSIAVEAAHAADAIHAADTPLFVANKEIKEFRQELTQALITKRTQVNTQPRASFESEPLTDLAKEPVSLVSVPLRDLKFNVVLRKKEQVSDLIAAIEASTVQANELATVILDFEFGRDYISSIELLKKHNLKSGLATTRILKPKEYRNLNALIRLNPEVILIRNLGALQFLHQQELVSKIECRGDFSLNVTNHWSSEYLLGKGLQSLCVSYDLNRYQVNELIKNSKPKSLEITVHQYMPSFHMEHCVFAAFLSEGKSWRDCGKPCEKHQVQLRDQFGHLHDIKPDQECRNTMYNSQSQSAARFIEEWAQLGLGSIRYEALNERDSDLITKISAYADYLNGRIDFVKLSELLGKVESYGLTEGSLNRLREYQSRKKN